MTDNRHTKSSFPVCMQCTAVLIIFFGLLGGAARPAGRQRRPTTRRVCWRTTRTCQPGCTCQFKIWYHRNSCAERKGTNKVFRFCAFFAVSLALLASCQIPGQQPVQRKLTIAWINKSLGNPVFEHGYRGAMQKAAELSARGPFPVEVLAVGPATADAVEQTRVIDDVIARGVDGIAVSCNDPTACIDPINKAVIAGIPVMTWDSDSPQSRRFTYLAIDNYGAGQTAADLLAHAIGEQGKIGILTGVPGALNLEQRVRGFESRLAAYPQIQVVATVYSNEDINMGVQGVEETMQAHPDLSGWFFAGMWPLFADRGSMPLWEAATDQHGMKTVAFDTLPVELQLVREGYLAALIGQKYWGWGYDSIQIVYDRIVSGKQTPSFIDTGVDIVTHKNVEAMIRAWETNDFSQPLPAP